MQTEFIKQQTVKNVMLLQNASHKGVTTNAAYYEYLVENNVLATERITSDVWEKKETDLSMWFTEPLDLAGTAESEVQNKFETIIKQIRESPRTKVADARFLLQAPIIQKTPSQMSIMCVARQVLSASRPLEI